MLELYLIRHGLAGRPLEDKTKDSERRLTKKGKVKMKEIAKSLKELKLCFDIVMASPLLRAKETAEIIHAYCGNRRKMVITDLLCPGASYDKLIKSLNTFKNTQKIAVIGHEPFLTGFASYCLSKNKNSFMNLKKGGFIKLEIDGLIKPGHCILTCLMEPKQITRN